MNDNQTAPHPHRRGIALASVGVFVLSFDAVLVRLANASEWDVTFWRGWLICAAMAVYMVVARDWPRRPASRAELIATGTAMVLYGINTALFVISVSHTRVANTVVILSASPFFAAVFSALFLKERIAPRTWWAIAVAFAGVLVVFSGAMGLGTWTGDLAAIVLALSMGVVLTTLRRFPRIKRVPVVCGSGAVAGLMAWPLADPLALSLDSYVWLGIMGLAQMPVAMLLITSATRFLPSPEVALFLLIETVLGPVWVWGAVGEEPPGMTLVGGAAVLGAVVVHSWLALRQGRDRSAVKMPA